MTGSLRIEPLSTAFPVRWSPPAGGRRLPPREEPPEEIWDAELVDDDPLPAAQAPALPAIAAYLTAGRPRVRSLFVDTRA
jgi:hypothetical protein